MIVTNHRAGSMAACTLIAGFLTFAAPLAAQNDDREGSKGESGYVTALRQCQLKTEPAERLACYDSAATVILSASAEGEVRIVERKELRETRRSLFGFALPDLGIFGKSDKNDPGQEKEFTTLETTITSVRRTPDSYILVTKEGAEWQLDDVPARLMPPKPGHLLEIRKGALSSYFLRIDGQKGVKGRRVR